MTHPWPASWLRSGCRSHLPIREVPRRSPSRRPALSSRRSVTRSRSGLPGSPTIGWRRRGRAGCASAIAPCASGCPRRGRHRREPPVLRHVVHGRAPSHREAMRAGDTKAVEVPSTDASRPRWPPSRRAAAASASRSPGPARARGIRLGAAQRAGSARRLDPRERGPRPARAGGVREPGWRRPRRLDRRISSSSVDALPRARIALDTSLRPRSRSRRRSRDALARGLVAKGAVRRVAVVGPGLDFVDKAEGQDFYPPQSLQALALVDSLVRPGLADRRPRSASRAWTSVRSCSTTFVAHTRAGAGAGYVSSCRARATAERTARATGSGSGPRRITRPGP